MIDIICLIGLKLIMVNVEWTTNTELCFSQEDLSSLVVMTAVRAMYSDWDFKVGKHDNL